jgi:hypothetical protein
VGKENENLWLNALIIKMCFASVLLLPLALIDFDIYFSNSHTFYNYRIITLSALA